MRMARRSPVVAALRQAPRGKRRKRPGAVKPLGRMSGDRKRTHGSDMGGREKEERGTLRNRRMIMKEEGNGAVALLVAKEAKEAKEGKGGKALVKIKRLEVVRRSALARIGGLGDEMVVWRCGEAVRRCGGAGWCEEAPWQE